jgi:hypothetical protein
MDKKEHLPGLLEEEFISFYPSLAVRTGVNEALILQKLHYLVKITEKAKNLENFIEGRWWVYNTYEAWRANYFPWLAVGTIKRLFLDLEEQGIVLSYTRPGDDQKKYYTIRYEAWKDWFEQDPSQNETGSTRRKIRRDPSQNETTPSTNCDGGASQNESGPGTNCDAAHLYKESVTTSNLLSETTTATGDPPTPGEPPNPQADVVVDALIQSEIEKLGLLPDIQTALLGKGSAYALAVAWAARGPRVVNPAGLARSLMDGGGPPELLLKTAEVAVELGTVDRQEAERELGRREHEQLMADAHRIVEEQAPSPEPDEPASKIDSVSNLPGEDESDNGLDFQGDVLTVGEAWKATLLNMRSQLSRETFNGYYAGTEAKSFQDGVLTLVPRNAMGKVMLTRYRQSWEVEVSKLAGTPVRIEIADVSAGPQMVRTQLGA